MSYYSQNVDLFIHKSEYLWVSWNGVYSDLFNALNCVKQGAISARYCSACTKMNCYRDIGCHIGNIFMWDLGYADDICLQAPS